MEKNPTYQRYGNVGHNNQDGGETCVDQAPIITTPRSINFLDDVPLQVVAEIGRCSITIRTMLSLARGSLLFLGEEPHSQITLRANGNEIARGEVVTVNDKFGVRVTDIKTPTEE